MHIKSIKLVNFRNYENEVYEFDPHLNIFFGENGQGKTNLLEALFYLTVGKSHRRAVDLDIITFNHPYFKIDGTFQTRLQGTIHPEIFYDKQQGKIARINSQRIERFSELLQLLAAVSLSPEDIELTKGSPSARRYFLDLSLSQTDVKYLHALQEYRQVINQRNELIRVNRSVSKNELSVWDEQLIKWGSLIIGRRFLFLLELQRIVNQLYHQISGDQVKIYLHYSTITSLNMENKNNIEKIYSDALTANYTTDLKRGQTTTGPHRDDIFIQFNDHQLRKFGSQGQHRLVSTILRLSQALYLKEANQDCPLILVDDVFAELDSKHKQLILDMLLQFEQIFIATPRHDDVEHIKGNYKLFTIQNGKAQEELHGR